MYSLSLSAYKWMHGELKGNVALQYLAWVSYPMILVMFASLFCHLVSPQAIGELSITCQPLLSSPTTCFYLLLFVFLLREDTLTSYFFLAAFTVSVFSLCFFSRRFWYPWAENHPKRCRPEGVSDPESFHSQSHRPYCWSRQWDASGQRGKQTNPPFHFFIIWFFFQCLSQFIDPASPSLLFASSLSLFWQHSLFFLWVAGIINHPLSCFPSLPLFLSLMGLRQIIQVLSKGVHSFSLFQ